MILRGLRASDSSENSEVKAVATLSMFNTGRVRREGYMSSQIGDIQERLKAASDARASEIETVKIFAAGTVDFDALTDEAIEKITNDKELFLIPGAFHIQTYYVTEYVEQEINKLKEFFGKHL